MSTIRMLPCLDDRARGRARRRELVIPPERALALVQETLAIVRAGEYTTTSGRHVSIASAVERARRGTLSLTPDAPLPEVSRPRFDAMRIQVANSTTTSAARQLPGRVIVLNFANGTVPGGGFRCGALAQEESLCRASALYATLLGDPMYRKHEEQGDSASSDHAILSPDVPFFRRDSGDLAVPTLLSVLTCAAPIAHHVGHVRAAALLRNRIHRVLAIMQAYAYDAIVLGAWGCGAFGCDPHAAAEDFRDALTGPYRGAFRDVVFAIADWSPERTFLGPFRDAFAAAGAASELGGGA